MIVLITGCNTGLGLHCVRALASRDAAPPAAILLACRSPAAAAAAADAAAAATGYARASLVVLPQPLDLASLASVRAYAAAVTAWLGGRRLAALVNNAGVGGSRALRTTADGFDSIFQTNHLGHFLLTLLLLPSVAGARIVNVSSEVHDAAAKALPMPEPSAFWPPALDSPEWQRAVACGGAVGGEGASDSGQRRYTRSKLLNVLFTHELARQLSGAAPHAAAAAAAAAMPRAAACALPGAPATRVLAYNPGLMLDTAFVASLTGSWLVGALAWLLTPALRWTSLGRFLADAPSSGAALAELALPTPASAPWLDAGATAAYYDKRALAPASAFARSADALAVQQQRLWCKSLAWARVSAQELEAAGLTAAAAEAAAAAAGGQGAPGAAAK